MLVTKSFLFISKMLDYTELYFLANGIRESSICTL